MQVDSLVKIGNYLLAETKNLCFYIFLILGWLVVIQTCTIELRKIWSCKKKVLTLAKHFRNPLKRLKFFWIISENIINCSLVGWILFEIDI